MITGKYVYENATSALHLQQLQTTVPIENRLDPTRMSADLRKVLCEMMALHVSERITFNQLAVHPYFRLYEVPIDFGGFDLRQLMQLQLTRADQMETNNRVLKIQLKQVLSVQDQQQIEIEELTHKLEQLQKVNEKQKAEKDFVQARNNDLLKRETGLMSELSSLLDRHSALQDQEKALDAKVQTLLAIVQAQHPSFEI